MTKFLMFIKRKWVVVTIAAVVLAVSIGGIVLATNGFSGTEKGSSSKQVSAENSAETASTDTTSVQTFEPEAESEEEQGESEVSEVQEPESQISEEPQVSSEAPKKNAWLDGYVPTHGEPGEIDAELLKEIQNAYAEKYNSGGALYPITPEDVIVNGYCGAYNGYTSICVYGNNVAFLAVVWEMKIDDVTFYYGSKPLVDLYKDGEFFTIQESYENGFISNTDLKDIAYYQFNSIKN